MPARDANSMVPATVVAPFFPCEIIKGISLLLVLTISDYGGTIALGLLVSIALLIAMLSNLILLPALLLSLEHYIKKKNN